MNARRLSIVAFMAVLGGCTDPADPVIPKTEQLVGQFSATRQLQTFPVKSTDSVSLRVTGSHYSLTHLTHETLLCDAEGTVGGFGTNVATFTPSGTIGSNCDSVRTLRGAVDCVWVGDSLHIVKRVDSLDVIWELKLKMIGSS